MCSGRPSFCPLPYPGSGARVWRAALARGGRAVGARAVDGGGGGAWRRSGLEVLPLLGGVEARRLDARGLDLGAHRRRNVTNEKEIWFEFSFLILDLEGDTTKSLISSNGAFRVEFPPLPSLSS